MFKDIIFLDDLLRYDFWPAKEFFYDNLSFVIESALNIKLNESIRKSLTPDGKVFIEKFNWIDNYSAISEEYSLFLDKIIRNNALVIGYELSPGLTNYLDSKHITWINFRISPLRFLDDLVIAITSSSEQLRVKFQSIHYPEYEIKHHAHKLSASYRHRDRYHPIPNDGLYFIGQTSSDASLILNNKMINVHDYKNKMLDTKKSDVIFYLKHPSSTNEHANFEINALKKIYKEVKLSNIPLYDLFFSEYDNKFISISSGSLQESVYFDKFAEFLFEPICKLSDNKDFSCDEFVNITFNNFIDARLWEFIFDISPQCNLNPANIKYNELRNLHNVWWGYAKVLAKETELSRELSMPVLNQIESLHKKSAFLAKLISSRPGKIKNIITGFSGGKYQWFDREITFTQGGDVIENNISVGEWRIINTFGKKLIVIWNGDLWIDSISTRDKWQTMNCRNNDGFTFDVKKSL